MASSSMKQHKEEWKPGGFHQTEVKKKEMKPKLHLFFSDY